MLTCDPGRTQVQTRLPSSDEAFQSGIEEPSSTLTDALSYQDGPRSAFVCKIVAMHLYNECFESSAPRADLTNPGGEAESAMFWDRYRRLEASLAIALATLPEPMRCPGNPYDANAILINMQLQTAVICLCRAAWSRARAEGGPIPDLDSKVTPAAQHIVTVIALAADINDKFRNPFVAFAGFMAASVFHKDWMHTRSDESGRKLTALLDVMVSVGSHNPGFSAMLAVQLAREMEKTGADPAAMSKVRTCVWAARGWPGSVRCGVPSLTGLYDRSSRYSTRGAAMPRCSARNMARPAWLCCAPCPTNGAVASLPDRPVSFSTRRQADY